MSKKDGAKKGSMENPVTADELSQALEGKALKPYIITGASLKDDFCNYAYEVTEGIASGETHKVTGIGFIDEDLRYSFGALRVHLAAIDDIFAHAGVQYYDINMVDRSKLEMNKVGSDFTDESIKRFNTANDTPKKITGYANRLLKERKNLLVFCSLISEAVKVAKGIPGAVVLTGETEISTRSRILREFTTGKIRCIVNVGVLAVGFDYPELECVLIAKSTMSLALYYQIIGRVMRPHPSKESAWVVDLGGNLRMFGRIETMKIEQNEKGLYYISNIVGGYKKQLTNVTFQREAA